MVMGMAKICKNCACYEVCIWANPCRTEDCNHGWQPIIVRCKDCKHFYHSISSDRDGRCVQFGTYDTDPSVYPTDFCSYGERRTNEPEEPV